MTSTHPLSATIPAEHPRRFFSTAAVLAAALCLCPAAASENASQPAAEPVTLPRADQRMMDAKSNGATYRILISRPAGAPPANGWPVVYLLDGSQQFALASELVRVLSVRPEATGVCPAVVVGVGHPQQEGVDIAARTRDFTPPGADEPGTGGADAFLDFLVDELQPAIRGLVPVDPARQTLAGHSYGGLFTLHAFLNRPEAFASYIALSPSIWWNQRAVLKSENGFPARLAAAGPRKLFIGVGGFEQTPDPKLPVTPERKEKLSANRMLDNARELSQRLASLPHGAENITFKVLEEENHGSITPAALPRALAHALAPAAP